MRRNGMTSVYLWMLGVAVLFSVLYGYGISQAMEYVGGELDTLFENFAFPSWMSTILRWLAGGLLFVASFLLFHLINGTIVLILSSPVFSNVAKKAYEIEMGEKPKELPLVDSIGRGVLFALRNFGIQLLIWIVVYIVGFFVTFLSPLVPVIIVAVNAYYYAVSMADYTMELKGMSVGQSVRYGSQNKFMLCGIGLPFAVILLVPFVGSYLAILLAPVMEIAALRSVLNNS
ncbi:MAG: EI24 domain-containing protein [Bacteroidales bacterium]|nr:EI24 domain-containing protein [Bacteroidales bacterium]